MFDADPPLITCPGPAEVDCGQQNDLSVTGQAVATDDCAGPLTPTLTDDPPALPGCSGVIQRNWTATDDCGNTSVCTQAITVFDVDPPLITCPGPAEVDCGKQNDLTITGQATAEDACAGPLTPTYTDDPAVFSGCSGVILRTWTAVDPGGNSAGCVQEIAVTDESAPVFTFCPPPVSVPCGQQTNLAVTGIAIAQDACNQASPPLHTDDNGGFSGCSGVVVRTFLTADNCGNTTVCQQTITVFDNTPPIFVACAPPVFVYCGQENNLALTGMAVAEDACSGPAPVTHTDDLSGFTACEE